MKKKNKQVSNKKVNNDKKDISSSDFTKKGVLSTLDIAAPDSFHEERDYLYLGVNKYARVYALSVYPRTMRVGILNEFYELGDIDISTFIENIPDGQVIQRLTRKISALESNEILKSKRGHQEDYGVRLAIQDLKNIREGVQTNTERMFYTQTVITIWAKNLEELDEKSGMFEDICARKSMKARVLACDQNKGFTTALPIKNIKNKDNMRNITTGGVASLIPTGNTELSHNSGLYFGENIFTKSPIFYDSFIGPPTLANQHMFIVGKPGSGKSVFEKVILGRGASSGEFDVILDPENEYENLIEKLGGQYLHIKPGQKCGINVFDIEPEIDKKGNKELNIHAKCSDIKEMLSFFCLKARQKPLFGEEIAEVEDAIKFLYAERGITSDPESLYELKKIADGDGKFHTGKVKKKLPILSDLKEYLSDIESTKSLSTLMKTITGDGSLAMFDCETTININKRVIGFNLKHLGNEEDKLFCMFNLLSWVWAKFGDWKYGNILKRVIVDEGWWFAKFKVASDFLEEIARRGRKYKISLVIASQMISEFLASDSGKAIIQQCSTKVIMKQDPSAAGEVVEFFKLSSACEQLISTFIPGQAMLITEQEKVVMQVKIFDFEKPYVFT